jgi:hypothetical protein
MLPRFAPQTPRNHQIKGGAKKERKKRDKNEKAKKKKTPKK